MAERVVAGTHRSSLHAMMEAEQAQVGFHLAPARVFQHLGEPLPDPVTHVGKSRHGYPAAADVHPEWSRAHGRCGRSDGPRTARGGSGNARGSPEQRTPAPRTLPPPPGAVGHRRPGRAESEAGGRCRRRGPPGPLFLPGPAPGPPRSSPAGRAPAACAGSGVEPADRIPGGSRPGGGPGRDDSRLAWGAGLRRVWRPKISLSYSAFVR
jgi:hypothetical protein